MGVTNYMTVNGKIRSEQRAGEAHSRDYVLDRLGSVIQIYQNGWPIADACYEPYGGIYTQWNMEGKTFTWLGGWGYRQTGVEWSSVYVRARHYSRGMSNWTSIDPLWPSEMAYGYVNNEVLYWVDPSGLQRGVRNGGGSTSTNQGRNIWGRPAPRPAVGRDRMGRPWPMPPMPKRWPNSVPLPRTHSPFNPIPYSDPFPYIGVPMPNPGEYPRTDPVITSSDCPPVDPCVQLKADKQRRKRDHGHTGCKYTPPNKPGKVTDEECKRWRRAIENIRRICEIREDELKWRCFDPWYVPQPGSKDKPGIASIYGHKNQLKECLENLNNCQEKYRKECT